MPMPYSTNSLPSTSHTRAPLPRVSTGAMPSGYWSEPLAKVCAPPGTSSCRRAWSWLERSKLGVHHERSLSLIVICWVRRCTTYVIGSGERRPTLHTAIAACVVRLTAHPTGAGLVTAPNLGLDNASSRNETAQLVDPRYTTRPRAAERGRDPNMTVASTGVRRAAFGLSTARG